MIIPSAITSLVKQAHKTIANTHICFPDGMGRGLFKSDPKALCSPNTQDSIVFHLLMVAIWCC